MNSFQNIMIAFCFLATMSGCKETPLKRMEREANETNLQCPKMIDEFTRMDSLKFLSKQKSFHYYYAIKGSSDSALTALLTNPENKERITQQLTNQPDLRFYIEQQISFYYHYYSMQSHELLGNIEVKPEDFEKMLK